MGDKPLILAVDHNRRNLELMSQLLSQESYETVTVGSLEEFDQVLNERTGIKLALVDIAGFDRSVWERCERLRAADIPFVIISPRQSAALSQMGLEYGARGVLIKPLTVKELLGVMRSLL
ncbi:MAG: response regulator [Anaerolineae bacterium]|jgi:DNA-binding response OmpR family regulator|nr:response regulator [Anaerolineae bacterium]MDH7475354.1 response regulator [Anaerolineae bacterium]